MNKKRISVVIPVYNPEPFIKNIINALKSNLDYIGEIILVNNGELSQFDKLIEALRVAKILNFIIIQAEYRCGPGIARDIGVVKAFFKYIAFFDCDDIWNENHLKNSLELLESNDKIIMTYTDYTTVDNSYQLLTTFKLPDYTSYRELILTNYFAMPSIIIETEIAKKYKFGKRGHEDFHFLISVLKNENIIAKKVYNTPMKILRGHQSVSSNKTNAIKWHYERLVELNVSFIKRPVYMLIYSVNAILKRKLKIYSPVGLFLKHILS